MPTVKFLRIPSFYLVLLLFGASNLALAQSQCSNIFPDTQDVQILSQKIGSAFSLKTGTGFAKFQVGHFFDPNYVATLVAKLPRANSLNLINDRQDNAAENKLMYPDLDISILKPIYDYANKLLEALNDSLPEPEKGSLSIEFLRLAISDSNFKQIGETWHHDNSRYITSVTNLMGSGTLFDASGPHPAIKGVVEKSPDNIGTLNIDEAVIFNGLVRHFLFPGSGAEPLAHRAPPGYEGSRLAIVIFFAPKNMKAPKLGTQIEGRQRHTPESDALRAKWLKTYFEIE